MERITYRSFGGGNAARIFRGCFSGVSPALFRGRQVRQKNLVFPGISSALFLSPTVFATTLV